MKLDLKDFSTNRLSRILTEQSAALEALPTHEREKTVDFTMVNALCTPAYVPFVNSVRFAMQIVPQETIVALILLGYQMALEDEHASTDSEDNSSAAQP